MWKDFFYFTKTEQRGMFFLAVVTIGMFLMSELLLPSTSQEETSITENGHARQEYERFIAALQEKNPPLHKTVVASSEERSSFTAELSPFDPNTADSLTLRAFGLPAWMTSNILRYRKKKGKFRRPEDFRKIYGLTEEQFQALSPYIQIAAQPAPKDSLCRLTASHTQRDTLSKYPTGTVVGLNEADTTELKKIPGIGSHIAHSIIKHRKRLGGYYNIEQLEEIHLKAELLRPWFSIDTTCIQRININKASVQRLMSHPYINFYQAKAIVEYRQKQGEIKSLKLFSLYEEFTNDDFKRIAPYICYE